MLELTFSFRDLDPDAASRVVDAIRDVHGVEDVYLANKLALSDALHKGGLADVVAKIAPEALQRISVALAALLGLPGSPLGIIEVSMPHGPVRMNYDPRRQSLEEIVTQMLRLTGGSAPRAS